MCGNTLHLSVPSSGSKPRLNQVVPGVSSSTTAGGVENLCYDSHHLQQQTPLAVKVSYTAPQQTASEHWLVDPQPIAADNRSPGPLDSQLHGNNTCTPVRQMR